MKILFIGDVQGQENSAKLGKVISDIKVVEKPEIVIVNGENSADGTGITPKTAKTLFDSGADVITTGNHAFRRKEMDSMFNEHLSNVIRPANFGDDCPGKGFLVIDCGYCELCVVNIIGMVYMPPCDNPFKCADKILSEIKTPNIIVDFHAEATSEKKAMAFHLAGRVSAVIGTHTHVQTADEQIIAKHTAFISDVGMVGAVDSVIGVEKNVVQSFYNYYPQKHKVAEGVTEFNAVLIETETSTGRAISIERLKKII
ncbi:MAG: TIGR00282 family metallophosphoesterase [Oscillospiraceae bacterium]|nr:TIGR00282 family metallophosphoesterase [Oscillospiraceae bacterium]